jgi:hypothetical protein
MMTIPNPSDDRIIQLLSLDIDELIKELEQRLKPSGTHIFLRLRHLQQEYQNSDNDEFITRLKNSLPEAYSDDINARVRYYLCWLFRKLCNSSKYHTLSSSDIHLDAKSNLIAMFHLILDLESTLLTLIVDPSLLAALVVKVSNRNIC